MNMNDRWVWAYDVDQTCAENVYACNTIYSEMVRDSCSAIMTNQYNWYAP